MSDSKRRLLDPTERFSEILFGLIMVLTFTGTLSVAEAGRADVHEMLVAALGCNLAWGVVDAVMFVLAAMTRRGRGRVLVQKLRGVSDPASAHRMIADALPERVAAVLGPDDLESMRQRMLAREEAATGVPIAKADLLAALAVFLLVFLTTFPVALPFLVLHDPQPALRVSNAIALAMLFALGWSLARYTGGRPFLLGFGMLVVGAVLVAATIALGG